MATEKSDLEFRAFCVEQIERLGVFERFQFMADVARKEYRKFFENRTRDREKVEAVMDEALGFENFPSLVDLSGLWNRKFPNQTIEPQISDEERQARYEYLRDWYAKEAEEARLRRESHLKQMESKPTSQVITSADIDRVVGRRG